MGANVSREAIALASSDGSVILVPDSKGRSREWNEASYRGTASLHRCSDVKGNGAIVLTDKSVQFLRVYPKLRFVIPLAWVTHLSYETWFKSSAVGGRKHLLIHYKDREGKLDSMGFFILSTSEQAYGAAILRALHDRTTGTVNGASVPSD